MLFLDSSTPWDMGPGKGRPTTFLPMLALAKRGHRVLYLSAPLSKAKRLVARESRRYERELAPQGLQIGYFCMPVVSARRYLSWLTQMLYLFLYPFVATLVLRTRYRCFRPDLAIALVPLTAPGAFLVSRMFRVPYVYRQFGTFTSLASLKSWRARLRRLPETIALKLPADRYILTDDGTLLDKVAVYHGVPSDRVRFWKNGVDKQLLSRANPGKRTELAPNGEVVLLSVSRLALTKRIDAMVRAMPRLLTRRRDVVLVVVGGGEQLEALKSLADQLGVAPHVRFEGAYPGDRLGDYYGACDIFISLSTIGFVSNTTIEAMSCGACVCALDAIPTGGRDLIRHLETGYLISKDQLPNLADHLVRLIDDKGLRRSLGRNARELVHRQWLSWDDRVALEVESLEQLALRSPAAREYQG